MRFLNVFFEAVDFSWADVGRFVSRPSSWVSLTLATIAATFSLVPDVSRAAPIDPDFIVADYRATSSLSVSLVSAVFLDSGADARDAIDFDQQYGFYYDSAEYESGGGTSASAGSRMDNSVGGANRSVISEGHASAANPYSASGYQAFGPWGWFNYGTEDILLTLDYAIETEFETNVYDPLRGSAEAGLVGWSNNTLRFSQFNVDDYYTGRDDHALLRSIVRTDGNANGTYSAILGEDHFLDVYWELSSGGVAEYTEIPSVPLPSSFPLLLLSFGVLALGASHKKRLDAAPK